MEQTLTSLSSNAEELQKSITDHFGCKLNKGCVAWSCPEPDPPCPILHWSRTLHSSKNHLGRLNRSGVGPRQERGQPSEKSNSRLL
ncbi:unnamed protein product [Knipowitschia caucasica]